MSQQPANRGKASHLTLIPVSLEYCVHYLHQHSSILCLLKWLAGNLPRAGAVIALSLNMHRSPSSQTPCSVCWGGRGCDPGWCKLKLHVFSTIWFALWHWTARTTHRYSEWILNRTQSSWVPSQQSTAEKIWYYSIYIYILPFLAVIFIFFLKSCFRFQILPSHFFTDSQISQRIYDGISAPHSFSISVNHWVYREYPKY